MERHDAYYRQYVQILREELRPATGCTEPIAIAYAAAKARSVLGALPDRVLVEVSGNIIKNVKSSKMGKKDIIKISDAFEVNFDVLGYIDPEVTVCVIENGSVKSKHKVELPEKIVNIAKCKNPRCITSVEQEIDHVFKLTDREHQVYRCIYCESKLKK